MKPENFNALLNSYFEERIPHFPIGPHGEYIGFHISGGGKGLDPFRPGLILCGPTPNTTVHEEATLTQEESRICADQVDSPEDIHDENFRLIARKLIQMAQEYEQKHLNNTEEGHHIASEPPEDIMTDEWSTIRRIYSNRAPLNVSRIASILAECLTPQTFRGAVSFISERVHDVYFQLALTLELSVQVIERRGRGALDMVHRIMHEMFQQQTELEALRTTE